MNPSEINKRIAEARGWTDVNGRAVELLGFAPTPRMKHGIKMYDEIPNYYGDLNACHEMEMVMNPDQCDKYNDWLMEVKPPRKDTNYTSERWSWGSTAPQRCEAFLRTLGLWEDSK